MAMKTNAESNNSFLRLSVMRNRLLMASLLPADTQKSAALYD